MGKETPEQIAYARRIMAFKDFVPFPARFMIFVLLIIIYQSVGGIYMTAVVQMAGSSAWLNEDIMMAGYASLIGLIMFFPLMLRVFFAFEARTVLMTSTIVLIVGTIICMYSEFVPLVVLVSYICGFVKMMAVNYCICSIQLNITPTRDLAYFYPFLYTLIQSSIQLSGLLSGYSIWFYDWQTAHWVSVGILTLVLLLVHITVRRHFRAGPYTPFTGIDYIGIILWSSFLLGVLFIATYGEHYDWWHGEEIQMATLLTGILLCLSVERAVKIQDPFISLKTFLQPKIFGVLALYACYSLMYCTSGNIQNILTEAILGFDAYHAITLNWGVIAGILCGTVFSFMGLVKWKWQSRNLVIIGFAIFTMNHIMLYFLVDMSTAKEMLYLPMLLRGMALGILYVNITYILGCSVAFPFWFQALCVIGFIRTATGAPMCTALLTHMLNVFKKESLMQLSSEMDLTSSAAQHFSALYGELQMQSLMVGIKEVFGFVALMGVITIVLFSLSEYRGKFSAA